MKEINGVIINKPISRGDIIIKDVLGTGADVIATSDVLKQTIKMPEEEKKPENKKPENKKPVNKKPVNKKQTNKKQTNKKPVNKKQNNKKQNNKKEN